ncbi:MAG TPA: hypothetical protein VM243_00990 [Phycisphaerae bacterium]|nr:hypothetical protein [Phycisphaerae bacterium]
MWQSLNPYVIARGDRRTIVRMKRYKLSYVDRIIRHHEGREQAGGVAP